MLLVIAQCSSLYSFLCKASCPLRESTAPASLVSSANLLMVHSTPAYRLLINILNRTEPSGTLLVTGCLQNTYLQRAACSLAPFYPRSSCDLYVCLLNGSPGPLPCVEVCSPALQALVAPGGKWKDRAQGVYADS